MKMKMMMTTTMMEEEHVFTQLFFKMFCCRVGVP